jgi:uncharacterized membrane protein
MSSFSSSPLLYVVMKHKGVRWITLGWVAFIGENLVMSHNREWIIEQFGDRAYHQTYNVLSTMACASIAFGFFRHGRKQGPKIWSATGVLPQVCAFTFQTIGLVGFAHLFPRLQVPVGLSSSASLVQGTTHTHARVETAINNNATTALPITAAITSQEVKFKARCPIDFTPDDVPADGVYGLKRVTRHPTFWSLASLGLGAACVNPFATEVIMFTMPCIFASIGTTHQDYRYRRSSGGLLTPEVEARTCNIPFVALLAGKQQWNDLSKEIKHTNTAAAVFVGMALQLRRLR